MYEHRTEPLLPVQHYRQRQFRHALLAGSVILIAWAIGTAGYIFFEEMPLVDGMLNAAMILGGMGPVSELHTTGGKLFASFYAIFAGVGFIGAAGVLFAPAYHRFLHKFHMELREGKAFRQERGGA